MLILHAKFHIFLFSLNITCTNESPDCYTIYFRILSIYNMTKPPSLFFKFGLD